MKLHLICLSIKLSLLCSINATLAQNPLINIDSTCNKSVAIKQWSNLIPKGVCISKNYLISGVYDNNDFNEDGLNDFIINWNRDPLSDGDTIFTSFYMQIADSTYKLVKTFNHLYPVVFHFYNYEYMPQNTSLKKIQMRYLDYPLKEIKFDGSLINIVVYADTNTNFFIRYIFDKKINSWVIKDAKLVSLMADNDTTNYAPVFGPTIDDFTYDFWGKFYKFKGWAK